MIERTSTPSTQVPTIDRGADHVYELRRYTVSPGMWDEVMSLFRDHLLAILSDSNIQCHAFWKERGQEDVLVYLASHSGDPEDNWNHFRSDPRWLAIDEAADADNPLIASIETRFLTLIQVA